MISIWLPLGEQKIAEMILMKCSLTYMPLKISQLFVSISFFFPLAFLHMHLLGMSYKGMSSPRGGGECTPVFKSCHQDPDTGEDFFSHHYIISLNRL